MDNKNGKAIRKYTDGSVSLGKASEIAGVPKRLFRYKLQEIGIQLTESDFDKGMDTHTKAEKFKHAYLYDTFHLEQNPY